jgi:hypothetical protein
MLAGSPILRNHTLVCKLHGESQSAAAIRTNSVVHSARIFHITCPRCIFTAISRIQPLGCAEEVTRLACVGFARTWRVQGIAEMPKTSFPNVPKMMVALTGFKV